MLRYRPTLPSTLPKLSTSTIDVTEVDGGQHVTVRISAKPMGIVFETVSAGAPASPSPHDASPSTSTQSVTLRVRGTKPGQVGDLAVTKGDVLLQINGESLLGLSTDDLDTVWSAPSASCAVVVWPVYTNFVVIIVVVAVELPPAQRLEGVHNNLMQNVPQTLSFRRKTPMRPCPSKRIVMTFRAFGGDYGLGLDVDEVRVGVVTPPHQAHQY